MNNMAKAIPPQPPQLSVEIESIVNILDDPILSPEGFGW
jgi:hypothetical protein